MMSSKGIPLSAISLFAGAVGVVAYYAWATGGTRLESSSSSSSVSCSAQPKRNLSSEEQWIKSSILETMPPAARLGITIGDLNEKDASLSLQMPLQGNTNIHGTAFAGSLYSLAALCAWYTIVSRLRAKGAGLADRYTVVLKSAEISYLRPVVDPLIVAKSSLPSANEFHDFLARLEESQGGGKATINITGKILLADGGKDAAQYTAVLCAFKPRQKTEKQ